LVRFSEIFAAAIHCRLDQLFAVVVYDCIDPGLAVLRERRRLLARLHCQP
jgi:hypothetical protein